MATDLGERPHRLEAARRLGALALAAEDGREARANRFAFEQGKAAFAVAHRREGLKVLVQPS